MYGRMTEGRIIKRIVLFSLPIMLGNFLSFFYNMVDTIMVGQLISVEALAAVGVTGSIVGLTVGFTFGLSMGFTIPVAQAFGAGDQAGMRRYAANGVAFSVLFGVCAAAGLIFLSEPLLRLINTPDDIMELSSDYLKIVFTGIPFVMLYNVLADALRAIGNSRASMMFLILSGLCNVALNAFFIIVLRLGVTGVAVATVASQGISFLLVVVYLFRHRELFAFRKRDFLPDTATIAQLLGYGLPMALQSSITNVGNMILQGAINGFGSSYIAAFTAASKVEQMANVPISALGAACSTFCGQNYGARQYGRIKQAVRRVLGIELLLSLGCSAFLLLLGRTLSALFVQGDQTEILSISQRYLSTISLFYWALALLFVFRGSLQGMGVKPASVVAAVFELIGRMAVAYVLAGFFGFTAICLAGPIAWIAADIPMVLMYRGKMKRLPAAWEHADL